MKITTVKGLCEFFNQNKGLKVIATWLLPDGKEFNKQERTIFKANSVDLIFEKVDGRLTYLPRPKAKEITFIENGFLVDNFYPCEGCKIKYEWSL